MPLTGDVATLPLADIVRLSTDTGRSFRVRVRGGWATGVLFVEGGAIVFGEYGDLRGEPAVFAILAERDLRFVVEPAARGLDADLHIPWKIVAAEEERRTYERTERRRIPLSRPWRQRLRRLMRGAGPPALGAALVVIPALFLMSGLREAPVPADQIQVDPAPAPGPTTIVEEEDLTRPGDTRPSLLGGSAPPLPAMTDGVPHLRPTIALRLLVDTAGRVAQRRLLGARPGLAIFEEAALAAASNLAFSPASRGGRPVSAWIGWPLTFATAEPGGDTNRHLRVESSAFLSARLGRTLLTAHRSAHPTTPLWWDGHGSAVAVAGLLDGTVDAAVLGRPLHPGESAEAKKRGVRLAELILAHDGLAVIVHPSNATKSLTIAQVARLFHGDLSLWTAVGGADRPVRIISPGVGTDENAALQSDIVGSEGPSTTRATVTDDPLIVMDLVAADADAVGVVPVALLDSRVRAVPISKSTGAVAFGPDEIRTGRYPLIRPVYLYTAGDARGEVARFAELGLSSEGQRLAIQAGFSPAVGAAGRIAVALPPPPCSPTALPPATPDTAFTTALVSAPSPMLQIHFGATDQDLARDSRRELERLARRMRGSSTPIVLVAPHHAGDPDGANHRRGLRVALFLGRREIDRARIQIRPAPADATPKARPHINLHLSR